MLPKPFQYALVLTGPTGSGKTQLGIDLALQLDAEIVSMDSMALYRGMNIGTAKPSDSQRAQVRHHLIDVLDPSESASVAWWLREAEACCLDIVSRGKRPLFVGGTPLYLKALCFGIFEGPPANPDIRQRLTSAIEQDGNEAWHRRLAEVDSVSAKRIHPNDARRIIRALEVYELTGRPINDWQTQWQQAPPESETPSILWLDLPREELYARIDRRVEEMFASGLVEEVAQLRTRAQAWSLEASQGLGYKEVVAYLEQKAILTETIVQVQTRTRNFAKRQITWFRHLPGCCSTTKELTWSFWGTRIDK